MPFVDLSNVRMQYREAGAGAEQILFVHGFQASARIWQPVQERLPARFHSIAPYNRGAGETTAPPDESDFGCKPFADDLFALVSRHGWTSFTLVGHSMGGATAMQFAVDHPELLKGLVLVDPAPPDGLLPEGADLDAAIDERMRRRAQQQAGPAMTELNEPHLSSDFVRALAGDIAAAPERRLRGSYRSMATLRLGGQVGTLTMPVLLVGGDADALVPLRSMLQTYAKLPQGSGLQIWHGVGHSPILSVPDSFCDVLIRFIEDTIPARRTMSAAI